MDTKARILKTLAQLDAHTIEGIDGAALDTVISRALEIMHADEVPSWLFAPEPLLGGSIPINVLKLSGVAKVIAALNARAAGAFA